MALVTAVAVALSIRRDSVFIALLGSSAASRRRPSCRPERTGRSPLRLPSPFERGSRRCRLPEEVAVPVGPEPRLHDDLPVGLGGEVPDGGEARPRGRIFLAFPVLSILALFLLPERRRRHRARSSAGRPRPAPRFPFCSRSSSPPSRPTERAGRSCSPFFSSSRSASRLSRPRGDRRSCTSSAASRPSPSSRSGWRARLKGRLSRSSSASRPRSSSCTSSRDGSRNAPVGLTARPASRPRTWHRSSSSSSRFSPGSTPPRLPPASLFAPLLALAAVTATVAALEDKPSLHLAAAPFVLGAEAVFLVERLVPANLLAGLSVLAAFGLFYMAVPAAARRWKRDGGESGPVGALALSGQVILVGVALKPALTTPPGPCWGSSPF